MRNKMKRMISSSGNPRVPNASGSNMVLSLAAHTAPMPSYHDRPFNVNERRLHIDPAVVPDE
jgi:hypothetical protein